MVKITIHCGQCGARYDAVVFSASYKYRTCKVCGNTMAKREWQSPVSEVVQSGK